MSTVLITGATSGIGKEFASYFAQKGYRLILTGRRKERLLSMKKRIGKRCRIITADLEDEKQCRSILKKVSNENIDIFINNAGFGTAGSFFDTDLNKEIGVVKVNDIAMHILFKGMLLKMKKQGYGTILNVASSAGLFPAGPYMATYYASKAYVTSLTKAVARELKDMGSNIYVCCLCPGPVDTEFNSKADVTFALDGITPKQCVTECIKGMRKRKTVIIPTLYMKLGVYFQGLLPERILLGIVSSQQRKKTLEK